ncbi:uncharacterized protein C12orf60 homolog [Phaenicophaeus curvirostris]|uniref:uncharacterized protein C12orf60 homolog n=1 Tax=Phaenicophaeus curvirostris TaxID=33595 RepID=UPI0037F0F5E5
MPVKEHFSIKDNLELMLGALKEMQATIETKDKDVEESIKHSLTAKVSNPITTLQDRITAVKEISDTYKGVVESIMGVLVAVMLKHDNILGTVVSAVYQLSSSSALFIQVSELIIDYADIVKMLQQNETLSTTEGSSSGISKHIGFNLHSRSSIVLFIRAILQEQRSVKKSLKIAADYLEEAFMVLKPPCEEFQTFVKMVEACVPTIRDKQQEA